VDLKSAVRKDVPFESGELVDLMFATPPTVTVILSNDRFTPESRR